MISKSFLNTINKNNIDNKINNNNKLSTENIIYSNELVNDIKLLRKCNSLESLDNYINNRSNDIKLIDTLIDKENYKIKTIISLESLNIFSLEDNISNVFKNIIKWIGDKINKFISWVIGLIKKLVLFLKGGKLKYTIKKVVEKFDVKKFKYLDTEIKIHPLLPGRIEEVLQNLVIPISQLIELYIESQDDQNIPSVKEVLNGDLITRTMNKYGYASDSFTYIYSDDDLFINFSNDFCHKYYLRWSINAANKIINMSVKEYLEDQVKENQTPHQVLTTLKTYESNDADDITQLRKIVSNSEKSAKILLDEFKKTQKSYREKINKSIKNGTYDKSDESKNIIEINRNLEKTISMIKGKIYFLTNVLSSQMKMYSIRNMILRDLCKALLAGQGLLDKDTQINDD